MIFYNEIQNTIFHQNIQNIDRIENEIEIEPKNRKRLLSQVKQQLRKILFNKRNIYMKENLISLRNRKILEGFAEDIPSTVQQCFYFFSQALANARSLRVLDISGMDLHPLLAIEIGIGLKHNTSLRELHMGSCRMNSFCLQYIFSSLTNHRNLQVLNLFNNQGFTIDLMNDLNQFILQGKNCIRKLKLTHCNIPTTAMSYLFRNMKQSKSIKQIDVSMIHFNTEVLTSLGIALEEYKGKEVLESLNISGCDIKDIGLETLAQRVSWNLRKINLKEIILRSNQITQDGVTHLEVFLRKISQIQKLDLSYNKIEEFNCQELHTRKMYEVHLVKNCISVFPAFFFMNTLIVNLSNNNIKSQGAFQLSSILRQNPLWQELNLTSNLLQSGGFNSLIFGLRDNRILKKLIVADNQLDGGSLVCYMINHEFVQFEYLDISLNPIRIQLIFVFLNFIKSGTLHSFKCKYLQDQEETIKQEFNIFNNSFGEVNFVEDGNQVFQLTSLNLVELDFQGNKNIFSRIANSLSTYYNKIEKLNLSECSPITDQDIEQICQFLRKSNMIKDLNLSNISLGNLQGSTIKKLSDAIILSSLKYVNLSRNKLYKNMKKIFKLNSTQKNFKIEKLDLSYNCLEGKHLPYIENILKMFVNLQDIDLSHNGLNFECLFAINRALEENMAIKRLNLSQQKFCADDLLILSQTFQSEGLQELNISNNLYTSKLKTFFYECSTQKLEHLTLEHIYFDDTYLNSAIRILKQQRRNLRCVSLEACFFQSGKFSQFHTQLSHCKKLEYISNSYNPFHDKELGQAVIESIPQFLNIKFLRLNQLPVTLTYLQGCSESLASAKCQLKQFELDSITFQQDFLNTLCQGISQNCSLKQLRIKNCQLGTLDLTQLGIAMRKCSSIEILDISKNNILNLNSFFYGFKKEESFTSLKEFNLSDNSLELQSYVELFSPCATNKKCLSISRLILSNCQVNNQILQSVLNAQINYQDMFNMSALQSACLSNNSLDQGSGIILRELIMNCPNLLEISFANNLLQSEGALEIIKGVLKNQSVKTLDLTDNQMTDVMIEAISSDFLLSQLKTLQFLLLRKNNFSQKAQKQLVKIIAYQNNLFIDYIWSKLDDQDGEQILTQYSKLGTQYHLDQQSIPNFIKEISIQNAFLTDKFSELLAKYYPMLSFIEFIDISDNPYITMYGKVYLFIHIFDQSYAKHNLKGLYIGDSQETTKLFDDGLLRYLLLKFKNFLQSHTQNNFEAGLQSFNPNEKSEVIHPQQRVGQLFITWTFHKINKLMTYLDQIEPPQFIVSTLFVRKFRKNNIQIKTMVFLLGLASLIAGFLQFYKIIFIPGLNYQDIENSFQKECIDQFSCQKFNNILRNLDIVHFFSYLMLISVIELFQLVIGVSLRRKIKPAFQIIHPSLTQFYQSFLPHTQEICRMIFSIIWKISSHPERLLIYYLSTFRSVDVIGYQYKLRSTFFVVFALVLLRYLKFLFFMIYNNFICLRMKPREDVAKFLQLVQKCMHYEGNFVISEILFTLCPLQGFSITKSLIINEEIIVSAMTILFIESLTLIILGILDREYNYLISREFKGYDPLGYCQIWIRLAFCKSLLAIFVMIFRILTIRPSIVKQHGFNQALTLKKFAENRNQFVPPSHMKIELGTSFKQPNQGGQQDQNIVSKQMEEIQELDEKENEEEYDEVEEGDEFTDRKEDRILYDQIPQL